MGFVIYNVATSVVRKSRVYKTLGAARAAMTREQLNPDQWRIAEESLFFKFVSKQVQRVNLMTGQTYTEDVNTPLCCSPASETYWSQ